VKSLIDEITPTVSLKEIELSRGFLRCSVRSLVPGIVELWTGLISAVGEIEIEELTPVIRTEEVWSSIAAASLGDQNIILYTNVEEVATFFMNGNLDQIAETYITEYLARKFFYSMSLTYHGFTEDLVWDRFECERAGFNPSHEGFLIRLRAKKTSARMSAFIELEAGLLHQLDSEWRRHIVASAAHKIPEENLVRIGQIAIQPTKLPELLTGKIPQTIAGWKNKAQIVDKQGTAYFFGDLITYTAASSRKALAFQFSGAADASVKSKMIRPGYVTLDVVIGNLKNAGQDCLQEGACSAIEYSCDDTERVALYMHGDKIASAAVVITDQGLVVEDIRSES
jgi:hypothetical protein